jgi:type I restriction enzyme S subunit
MAVSGVFAQVARGVGIQHLGISRFGALPFRLPPLAEQRRIAKAFSERIDHLDATRNALSSALTSISLQNKEILAAAISGDLIAGHVRENSSRIKPATHQKQSRIRQTTLFEETAKPSTFNGELPAGWKYITVENAGDATIGKQLSREAEQGSRLHDYLRVANIMDRCPGRNWAGGATWHCRAILHHQWTAGNQLRRGAFRHGKTRTRLHYTSWQNLAARAAGLV